MGTKVIVFQTGNLDSYYEQTMDCIYAKYHTGPSNFDHSPEAQERSHATHEKYGHHERLAQNIADEAQVSGEWPGNKVI